MTTRAVKRSEGPANGPATVASVDVPYALAAEAQRLADDAFTRGDDR